MAQPGLDTLESNIPTGQPVIIAGSGPYRDVIASELFRSGLPVHLLDSKPEESRSTTERPPLSAQSSDESNTETLYSGMCRMGLARSAPDRNPNSLLGLPAELRLTIFELVFAGEKNGNGDIVLFQSRPPSKLPLTTCRQIYRETRAVYRASYRRFWANSTLIVRIRASNLRQQQREIRQNLNEDDLRHVSNLLVYFEDKSGFIDKELALIDRRGIWCLHRYGVQMTTSCFGTVSPTILPSSKASSKENFLSDINSMFRRQINGLEDESSLVKSLPHLSVIDQIAAAAYSTLENRIKSGQSPGIHKSEVASRRLKLTDKVKRLLRDDPFADPLSGILSRPT